MFEHLAQTRLIIRLKQKLGELPDQRIEKNKVYEMQDGGMGAFSVFFTQSVSFLAHQEEGRNLRAAVEATVRQVKHPFPASKLPVRGRFRITCMVIGPALVSNGRRIQRYLEGKMELENRPKDPQKGTKGSQEQSADSIFAWLKAAWGGWNTPMMFRKLSFGC
jgi:hypothetical protein